MWSSVPGTRRTVLIGVLTVAAAQIMDLPEPVSNGLFSGRVLRAQESEQATRQFAVAVGFQNQKLYDSAVEEWKSFLAKFPADPRADKAAHNLGTCQVQLKDYPAAVMTFRQVLEKYPGSELVSQSLFHLGTALYAIAEQSGDSASYERAQLPFSRIANEFSKDPLAGAANYYAGECFFQQKQFEKASEYYSRVVRDFPDDVLHADALYALGVSSELLQKREDAVKSFAEFGKRFPKHSLITEVRMRHAEGLFATGNFAEAARLFADVANDQTFVHAETAMMRHARCLYELNQLEEAAALYWNLPRRFPQTKLYDAAILAGAKCYYLAGKYSQARSGLMNVSGRDVPEAVEATQWIARSLLKEKKPEEALKILDTALVRHAGSPDVVQLVLARIDTLYEIPERRRETVPLYAEFSAKYPEHELAAQALYLSALTSLDLGDSASAKKYVDQFLRKYEKNRLSDEILFIGGESALLLRDYEGAGKLYSQLLKSNPEHPHAAQAGVRFALSLCLAGRHDESLAQIDAVLPVLKDSALKSEALLVRGRCWLAKSNPEKAAESLESSLKEMPVREESAQTLLLLADVYQKLGRADDARQRLEQLRKDFPTASFAEEATFRAGELAYEGNAWDRAAADYHEVLRRWPEGKWVSSAKYGLAWTHFRKGDFQSCVSTAKELQKSHGGSESAVKVNYVLAMAEYQLGKFDSAAENVQAYMKSRVAPRELLDAQYLLGLCYVGLQKFDAAVPVFDAILRTNPKYEDADKVLYELGWCHIELSENDRAAAAFRRLASEFPGSSLAAESHFRVGESLYEAMKYVEASTSYSAAFAAGTDSDLREKAVHKMAWCAYRRDQFREAGAHFERQLKEFPGGTLSGDAEFLLGECEFRQQRWKSALEHYGRAAAAKHPVYEALAIHRSGECAAAMEDWAVSLSHYQDVLSRFPKFELRSESRYGAGWALQQRERYAEAVAMYEQVTEETASETAARARFMIGECYFAQKQHKEATRHFLKAAFAYNHKEWSAMSWFEAGRCFEVLRDIDQARNCYETLIRSYPEHARVTDARKRLSEL